MMKNVLVLLGLVLVVAGCAGPEKKEAKAALTLKAPSGTPAAAGAAVEEGNKLFAQGQWAQAQAQYEAAIKVQPELAEAHYDLALTLDRQGHKKEATAHYKEAANLAPGNQVIWNAPPFRKYGNQVEKSGLLSKDKAYMDPGTH